jgi:hypothetical protein
MENVSGDSFVRGCQHLKLIAELNERGLFKDAEYQELRERLILELKQAVEPSKELPTAPDLPRERVAHHGKAVGQLHAQIVQRILATHEPAGIPPKERLYRALGDMAERGILYPGDSALLAEMIEAVYPPAEYESDDINGAYTLLINTQSSLNEVDIKLKAAKATSPATQAIVDTTQQSVTHAAKHYQLIPIESKASRPSLAEFWNKYVLPDVTGAFVGCSAAADIVPIYAPQLDPSIQLVAAIGAIVAAGVTSGRNIAEKFGNSG